MGRGKKQQSDWFVNATDTQLSLLDVRAHNRVLQINSIANRREFR